MSKETLHKITGAILTSYLASHYLEEIKHTEVYRQKLKSLLNSTTKELESFEKIFFDKVSEIDEEDWSDKLSANLITFLDAMIKNQAFPDFCKLQEIIVAYTLDPDKISNVSDTILLNKNID